MERKGEIGKDEYLLHSESVKGEKAVSKDKFYPLYQQKPNKKFPLLGSRPYFYFYIIGKPFHDKQKIEKKIKKVSEKYDPKIAKDSANDLKRKFYVNKKDKKIAKLEKQLKEGNGFMRTFGEAPAIADKEKLERTASMFRQMLNAKGYFHNKVTIECDTNGKKLEVLYKISEGIPHKIDTAIYEIGDSVAQKLILASISQSLLKKNNRLDESQLVSERDRIDKLLKDNGYFFFEKQFIRYEIDTNQKEYSAKVLLSIQSPDTTSNMFRRYRVGQISCLLEYSKFGKNRLDTIEHEKIRYVQAKNKYGKKVISGKIKFRPNEYYSQQNTISTQLNLANLDNFKYIDIRYLPPKPNDTIMDVVVILNSNKKYQITDEWGLNVTQGLPGPQGSISFLDRNVLRGCENVDASVRYGIEGVASATDPNVIYKTAEGSADLGITFPQLYFPTKLRFKFNNYFPRTRFSFAFNNIVRPEYSRRNYKLAVNYTFIRNNYSRYNFAIADLNVVQTPRLTSSFNDYLARLLSQGNTLYTSFLPSFVSSMHFTYIYNNNDFTKFVNGSFLRLFAESGGTTMQLLEGRLKNAGVIDKEERLFGELIYYKFLKFNVDFRQYRSVLPKSQLAYRINAGVASAIGENRTLPYEKYFFSGGSNSIRAWRPRRLGPGSQAPTTFLANGNYDYKFEQPGEIILESSVESRFKIIKFIEGAVFADGGNVWRIGSSLTNDVAYQFSLDRFYKEIAFGAGLGLRFNFTFILIRFDLGMKVYDPAYKTTERWVVKEWSFDNVINKKEYGILNIGIGYPF